MDNLKVNSKTKINEFKRKHNWLVENATFKLNVSNIKSLSNDDIENLKCGDVVLKEDVSGKHAYLVTFKNDTGICLTYVDASIIETQSYDKVDGEWVYNSEDLTKLPINGKYDGDLDINGNLSLNGESLEIADNTSVSGDVEFTGDLTFSGDLSLSGKVNVEEGTIDKFLGINTSGKIIKGASSGGKVYNHRLLFSSHDYVDIINSDPTPFTATTFAKWLYDNKFTSMLNAKFSDGYYDANGTLKNRKYPCLMDHYTFSDTSIIGLEYGTGYWSTNGTTLTTRNSIAAWIDNSIGSTHNRYFVIKLSTDGTNVSFTTNFSTTPLTFNSPTFSSDTVTEL